MFLGGLLTLLKLYGSLSLGGLLFFFPLIRLSHFFLSLLGFSYTYTRLLFPQVNGALFLFFFFPFYLFSLCSSCWIISAELPSCSLTLSPAISNFLLGPSDEISFHFSVSALELVFIVSTSLLSYSIFSLL